MALYYDVTIWVYHDLLEGVCLCVDVWVCVLPPLFCTPLSWLPVLFYRGQFMSCKDLTFCQQLRTVCSKKKKGAIRYHEHTFKKNTCRL